MEEAENVSLHDGDKLVILKMSANRLETCEKKGERGYRQKETEASG